MSTPSNKIYIDSASGRIPLVQLTRELKTTFYIYFCLYLNFISYYGNRVIRFILVWLGLGRTARGHVQLVTARDETS